MPLSSSSSTALFALGLALTAALLPAMAIARTEVGAALALPYVTGGGTETYVTLNNEGSAGYALRVIALDGDAGSSFDAGTFACPLEPNEITQIRIRSAGGGTATMTATCNGPGGASDNVTVTTPIPGQRGAIFVVIEDPTTRETVSVDAIYGEATVFRFADGAAYSTDAIVYRAGTGSNDGDRTYRFDGVEYEVNRSGGVIDFEAANADLAPHLIAFNPDGTTGAGSPTTRLYLIVQSGDAVPFSATHKFAGFEIVPLTDINPIFQELFLGTKTATLYYETVDEELASSEQHDLQPSLGDGNKIRRSPVLAWLLRDARVGFKNAAGARRFVRGANPLVPFGADPESALRLLEDPDGDGIESPIDVFPNAPSLGFDDAAFGGMTDGVIDDRGDQTLRIGRAGGPDAIEIETLIAASAPADAVLDVCGGIAQLIFGAGTLGTYTCSSVALRVELGTITIAFLLNGEPAAIEVGGGNAVRVDPESNTVTADPDNPDTLVIETVGGDVELPPGDSVLLGVEIEILRKHPPIWFPHPTPRSVKVAIYGSETFDVRDIVAGSLAFGPDGASPRKLKRRDLDRDGYKDLEATFRANETGIGPTDTQGCLTGRVQTSSGTPQFLACDDLPGFPKPRPHPHPRDCGVGAELVLVVPLLVGLRRRRASLRSD